MRPSVATFLINYYRKENIVSKSYAAVDLFPELMGVHAPTIEDSVIGLAGDELDDSVSDDLDEGESEGDTEELEQAADEDASLDEQLHGADEKVHTLNTDLRALEGRAGDLEHQVVMDGGLAAPEVRQMRQKVQTIEHRVGALDSRVHKLDGRLHKEQTGSEVFGAKKREFLLRISQIPYSP